MSLLFKDSEKITQINEEAYTYSWKKMAEILEIGITDKQILREFFLGNNNSEQKHFPKHDKCSGLNKSDNSRITEKRICRCMYYFDENNKKCKNCILEKKWKNIGKLPVVEYEWPTKTVLKGVGGMDLIIQDGEKKYALEVKPQDSTESISRMVAETLTYTLDCDKGYLPGICFFENSQQMSDYLKYKNNVDFQYILRFVKVYFIRIVIEDVICQYEIKPIEDLL